MALDFAHNRDQGLVDDLEVLFTQGTVIGGGHVRVDCAFAVRFVNGHGGGAFQATDGLCGLGALIQEFNQFAVKVVDSLSQTADIHLYNSRP